MIVNQFIGTVTPSTEVFKEVEGEKFYKGTIQMGSTLMSIVYSEYIANKIQGRVRATGYVRSDRSSIKIFTFINVMDAVPTKEEESAKLLFDGKIITVKELRATSGGKEVLPMIVSYKTADGSTTLLHCKAMDKVARQLLGGELRCGMHVQAEGELHSSGNCVSVFINTAKLRERRSM